MKGTCRQVYLKTLEVTGRIQRSSYTKHDAELQKTVEGQLITHRQALRQPSSQHGARISSGLRTSRGLPY